MIGHSRDFLSRRFLNIILRNRARAFCEKRRAAMHVRANWIGRWELPECGDKIYFVSHSGASSLETLYTFYSTLPATYIRLGGEKRGEGGGHPVFSLKLSYGRIKREKEIRCFILSHITLSRSCSVFHIFFLFYKFHFEI